MCSLPRTILATTYLRSPSASMPLRMLGVPTSIAPPLFSPPPTYFGVFASSIGAVHASPILVPLVRVMLLGTHVRPSSHSHHSLHLHPLSQLHLHCLVSLSHLLHSSLCSTVSVETLSLMRWRLRTGFPRPDATTTVRRLVFLTPILGSISVVAPHLLCLSPTYLLPVSTRNPLSPLLADSYSPSTLSYPLGDLCAQVCPHM
uniref:Uncharacterized protein n=1 Tax=Lygus hesperus TaxID=30085 RepID=A0A0A9WT12_LYGHE